MHPFLSLYSLSRVMSTLLDHFNHNLICRNPFCEVNVSKSKCIATVDQDDRGHSKSSQCTSCALFSVGILWSIILFPGASLLCLQSPLAPGSEVTKEPLSLSSIILSLEAIAQCCADRSFQNLFVSSKQGLHSHRRQQELGQPTCALKV